MPLKYNYHHQKENVIFYSNMTYNNIKQTLDDINIELLSVEGRYEIPLK